MIDFEAAQKLVLDYINRDYRKTNPNDEAVILKVVEKEYGWIFFYNSKDFIETNDYRRRLYGNSPIVVEKTDGSIHYLGTARGSSDKLIEKYEKHRKHRSK